MNFNPWNAAMKSVNDSSTQGSDRLLSVRDLVRLFPLDSGRPYGRRALLRAVDGISFDVAGGETFGLVGESGSGKSTTARLILRLIEATSGKIIFDGVEVTDCNKKELQRLRREMQIILQDPLSSMNPRMSVGLSVAEPLRFHRICGARERLQRAREHMEIVGLSADYTDRLPSEFSGGQVQRVAIARALILRPKLIVLDEPVFRSGRVDTGSSPEVAGGSPG
jgi:ABC-type oligopeptide transport system ATPase subunit